MSTKITTTYSYRQAPNAREWEILKREVEEHHDFPLRMPETLIARAFSLSAAALIVDSLNRGVE